MYLSLDLSFYTTLKRITSFEIWLYKRILKISYTSHTSNGDVLNRVGLKEPSLLKTIKSHKLNFYGHICYYISGMLECFKLRGIC